MKNMKLDEDLIYEILSAVGEIPYGRVTTYGQIARLIGRDKRALGGPRAEQGRILWRLPMPPSGQSSGPHRTRLAGAKSAAVYAPGRW